MSKKELNSNDRVQLAGNIITTFCNQLHHLSVMLQTSDIPFNCTPCEDINNQLDEVAERLTSIMNEVVEISNNVDLGTETDIRIYEEAIKELNKY